MNGPPYRGMGVGPSHVYTQLKQSDIDNFIRWSNNAIHFNFYWTLIEEKENNPGVYNEGRLTNICEGIRLAEKNGLKVFIGVRLNYGSQADLYYTSWSENYNYHDLMVKYEDRYVKFLMRLHDELPEVGLDVYSFFPFHRGQKAGTYRSWYYFEALPRMVDIARNIGFEDIVVTPIFQGARYNRNDGQYLNRDWIRPEWLEDPHIFMNINSHDGGDPSSDYNRVVQCGEWNEDLDELNFNYSLIEALKNEHPKMNVMCVEFSNLNIHGCSEPETAIRPSGLAWVQGNCDFMNRVDGSGFYFQYNSKLGKWGDPRLSNGNDSELARILAEWCGSYTDPCAGVVCPVGWHCKVVGGKPVCAPDAAEGCIIAFLLTSAELTMLLPYLRQFRSFLPSILTSNYYIVSDLIMKGVRLCVG